MKAVKYGLGSRVDDFLREEDLLEGATAVTLKGVIAWQISREMQVQSLTKTELAKRMGTSRAALNRLLDASDPSLTLTTLASAAEALGKTISLRLHPRKAARKTSNARRKGLSSSAPVGVDTQGEPRRGGAISGIERV